MPVLGPLDSDWTAAVVPLAAFTLALATLALLSLLRLIGHRDTHMDTPMDVDDPDSHSELPFPGEVVDGKQTIQYFNV
jgi:hypothetical protein